MYGLIQQVLRSSVANLRQSSLGLGFLYLLTIKQKRNIYSQRSCGTEGAQFRSLEVLGNHFEAEGMF